MEPNTRFSVLIVAAGSGQRVGGVTPKQYRSLHGRPLLRLSIEAMQRAVPGANIRVAIDPAHRDLYDAATAGLTLAVPIAGGKTRAETVRNALRRITVEEAEIVLIHDAARPFPSADLVQRLIEAVDAGADGAVPGIPISDSLKRTDASQVVSEDVDRHALWAVQTPQVFRLPAIAAAFEAHFQPDATDDVAIARAAGCTIAMVLGDPSNSKLTYEADFAAAEQRIAMSLPDVRIGSGFDVHAFCPGDHVMLCGVCVPHDKGLAGHSDADVALHALTDAVLGALSAGDIGSHFPPSDERWRGAASEFFLQHARELVEKRGGIIAHCDITLICEAPKIGPHRTKMVDRIAGILALEPSRVSVKATTTERLGFTGRGEGIAAMATATVRLP